MKILITGAGGQLGIELGEVFKKTNIQYVALNKEQLDIVNKDSVFAIIKNEMPTHIINAAAYTKVDACEVNYEMAYDINTVGAMNIAMAANDIGAVLIHISTDFIFDGLKKMPYSETDEPNPISVYGKTKLAGEETIVKHMEKYFIVRTSWLFGKYGNNFVKTMIALGKKRKEIAVVDDQIGSPTYVTDLVEFILKIINSKSYGVYHFSNAGNCTWREFAQMIFHKMHMKINVLPITSEEYGALANRPHYSVLDTTKAQKEFRLKIRLWNKALDDMLNYISMNNLEHDEDV